MEVKTAWEMQGCTKKKKISRLESRNRPTNVASYYSTKMQWEREFYSLKDSGAKVNGFVVLKHLQDQKDKVRVALVLKDLTWTIAFPQSQTKYIFVLRKENMSFASFL